MTTHIPEKAHRCHAGLVPTAETSMRALGPASILQSFLYSAFSCGFSSADAKAMGYDTCLKPTPSNKFSSTKVSSNQDT